MRAKQPASFVIASLFFAACAMADGGNNSNSSFQSSVIGSSPNTTIGGVSSAGAKWTTSQSSASIQPDSQGGWAIQVQVQNLVLASGSGIGTTGSVRAVAASVVCGGSGGQVAASSHPAALDRSGAAQIQETLALPAVCIAPVVLVRVSSTSTPLGPFIATTGLSGNGSNAADSLDDNGDHNDRGDQHDDHGDHHDDHGDH